MFEGPIGLPYKKLMGDAKWAQMMEPPKFDAIPPRYKGTAAWPWKYDYMHQAMVVKTFLKQGIDEFVKANKGRMESHGNIASFCKLLKNPRATTKQIDAKMEEVAKLLRHNQMYPELPKELAERLMSGETHGLELVLRYGDRLGPNETTELMHLVNFIFNLAGKDGFTNLPVGYLP